MPPACHQRADDRAPHSNARDDAPHRRTRVHRVREFSRTGRARASRATRVSRRSFRRRSVGTSRARFHRDVPRSSCARPTPRARTTRRNRRSSVVAPRCVCGRSTRTRDSWGRACEITLVGDDEPCATGVFAGVDSSESCYLMEALTSTLGTTARARVRVADVSSLRFRASAAATPNALPRTVGAC